MSEENVSPPGKPNYVADGVGGVKAGRGMGDVQEPAEVKAKAETTDKGEETPPKNEEKASDTPKEEAPAKTEDKPKEKAEGDAERSSKLIAEIGEDRKRFANELIELARESETAAEKVKKLMEDDPRYEKLIKTKFGEDYDRLMEKKEPEGEIDLAKVKEQAVIEARAEIILKEAEAAKAKQFDLFAQSNGLNSDEADGVKENAAILEDKHGYEKALEMALMLVNRDKALASSGDSQLPKGGEITKEPEKKVEATPELDAYASRYAPGRSGEQVAEGLKRVEDRITTEGNETRFRLSD